MCNSKGRDAEEASPPSASVNANCAACHLQTERAWTSVAVAIIEHFPGRPLSKIDVIGPDSPPVCRQLPALHLGMAKPRQDSFCVANQWNVARDEDASASAHC
jgi:hypothetical protein